MYKTNLDFEIFNNGNLGKVRTAIDKNNQIWFVAKDICDILNIQNTTDTIKKLDNDEVQKVKISTKGGMQDLLLINEPGMYSLVLRSRKPQAKEFKGWLTHEVIPSIREHGGYIYQQEKLNQKDKEQLYDMVGALQQSVTKFKTRWHELNSDKRKLINDKRELKKEIKGLKDYANTMDKMYDTLYEDFEKTYAENKQLKKDKYAHFVDVDIKSDTVNNYENEFTTDYYFDNQGFLIKNDLHDYDNEKIDMSERDGDYDLDI